MKDLDEHGTSLERCIAWVALDLPTSPASKAELGARNIYTM